MSNYTEEMTREMVGAYLDRPTPETVELLAEKYERSKKSIIGKLSREGVYRREVYVSKTGRALSRKWKSLTISLKILELRVDLWLAWRKVPKQHYETWKKQWRGQNECVADITKRK